MFDPVLPDQLDDLDAAATCEAVAQAHRDLVELEAHQLRLAAHWIDVHAPEEHPDAAPSPVLAGTERAVRVGSDGTPLVGEFAAAEFAAVQDLHPAAGAALLRKVADLQHRHPLLWARVQAGEVRAWKALETARLVGRSSAGQPELDRDAARWVDSETHACIDTLPWTAYLDLVERMIVAADPKRAETVRLAAATEQFVAAGQTTEHGLRTLVAKATAGDVVYLVAVLDRLADELATRGDTRPLGVRRAAALGILAHPAHALALLAAGLETAEDPADPTGESDVPSFCEVPADLVGGLRALAAPGRIDLDRLLPRATLHVHIGHDAFTGRDAGLRVADVEGIGAITLEQARQWLGHHRVTLVPVVDPADTPPVDGYQFTPRLREAIRATVPRDVFPWAVNRGRHQDIDHPEPYRWPARGGPPGQTGLHNAAPMTRHHHRLKTHAGWRLRQLEPGSYLWRSPHGYYWLVDRSGTYRVPAAAGAWIEQAHQVGRSVA